MVGHRATAGKIEGLEHQADQLLADLLRIDAAIRIFAPDYRPNDRLTAKEIALALMDPKRLRDQRRTHRAACREARRMLPARAAGYRARHVRGWAGADGAVAVGLV